MMLCFTKNGPIVVLDQTELYISLRDRRDRKIFIVVERFLVNILIEHHL